MLTSASSRQYADLALESFFKKTKLTAQDEFVLVDNDNEQNYQCANVKSNSRPQSFAQNVNSLIDYAAGRNIFLLSNDIVLTENWNEPLKQFSRAILLPSCNQTHCYQIDNWQIKPSMQFSEYQTVDLIEKAADLHRTAVRSGLFERLLMGFYLFHLPAPVYQSVGYFDEQFGIGGGEDVDYRLRAIQKGFPVKYHSHSYVLHFAGKSTWDGAEQAAEIAARNRQYFTAFEQKWGSDLANLCLVGGDPKSVVDKYQLQSQINSQEFSQAIKAVLNIANRN